VIRYRPYQLEDLHSIRDNYQAGISNQLAIQATGLGKTVLMSMIPGIQSELGLPGKVLVIVNRIELARQTKKKFEQANPDLIVGIEQAENRAGKECHIVVVSVQTVGTAQFDENGEPVHTERIKQIDPSEFSVVMVDETHRAPASTFRSTLMYFGVYPGKPNYRPWVLLLGFTATPNRTDNKGLEEFYAVAACNRNIIWGINNNWLSDIKAYRVTTSVNLDDFDIKTTKTEQGRDFAKKELEKAVNIPARNKLIIERYKELCEGHKGIFFCVDVQHAKDLCQMSNDMGIPGKCVFGSTNKDERKQILEDHTAGDFQALFSVNTLTEGYDDATIGVVCMCRPTQSKLFYEQAIGRGLRPFPSPEALEDLTKDGKKPSWMKKYCILIDFCDLSSKHNIVTVGSIFGVGAKFDFKGESVTKEAKKVREEISKLDERLQAQVEEHINDIESIEKLKSIVERIDLLKPPQVSQEIAEISTLEWLSINGKYEISLPGKDVIRIKEDTLGGFTVQRSISGNTQDIRSFSSLESAVNWSERECIPEDAFDLMRAEAKWKQGRPTDKQINHLFQLKKDLRQKFANDINLFTAWAKQNYTKGQLSQLIQECKSSR